MILKHVMYLKYKQFKKLRNIMISVLKEVLLRAIRPEMYQMPFLRVFRTKRRQTYCYDRPRTITWRPRSRRIRVFIPSRISFDIFCFYIQTLRTR